MSVIESTKPGAFISLATAADILGISVHTLRRRIAAGELPAFRSGRRIIRIRRSDVERLLRPIPVWNLTWAILTGSAVGEACG